MWENRGLVIVPQVGFWWMRTHAMLPTPEHVGGNVYRIYFSGRDHNNRSYIGYAVVELREDSVYVLEYCSEPVLGPGELGCFDDSGVTPSCILKDGKEVYLYYIGWRPRSSVRMELMPGLARSVGGNKFERVSKVPILRRTDKEPISILTAPYVLKEGQNYRMWYVSGIRWVNPDLPQYDIKYAESSNGFEWKQFGVPALKLESNENALARPFVFKDGGKYVMLFSYKEKGRNYRIGYATSEDGILWKRHYDKLYSPPASGWDSEMQAYAILLRNESYEFLLYNGNGYGREGIGYAVRKRKSG